VPITHNNNLEYRLFLRACLIAMFMTFIVFVLDTLIAHDYASSIAGVVIFFVLFLFFYQVKYKKRQALLLNPFIIILILGNNVAWFVRGGLNISNASVFLIILLLINILSPPSKRFIYLGLIFINLMVFTGLEFFYPSYSMPFVLDEKILVINSVVLFVVFGIVAYVMIFFKNQYDKERDTVRNQNVKLDISYSEIETQNEELIQYQEEVLAQRDFIEEKNNKLEQQATELESANEEIQAMNDSLEEKVIDRTKQLIDLNNDLDLLVYRSSHDFRRPLTTLMGINEVARLTVKDEVSKELFDKVNQTALNMDKMLMKFFMLYNINHYRTTYEGITLVDIINKVDKNMVSRKKNIIFNRKIETKNYHEIDERNSLIEVIIENLMENSLIYNSKGNMIIDLEIAEQNGELKINLNDNGDGIPSSYQDKIYDMYFRGNTLSTGNGLGLYVAKKAANLLNANMKLNSKEGEFSKFEISFPV
jgi:signal transduction histidine kinase